MRRLSEVRTEADDVSICICGSDQALTKAFSDGDFFDIFVENFWIKFLKWGDHDV
jgi:hypothetical protein